MNRFGKIVSAVFIFAGLAAQAQTVDEIVQKYTTAIGGSDNINKIKTLKITGTVKQNGMDLPLTMRTIVGRAVRTDIEFSGMSIIQSFKDSTGWTINPLFGSTTPQAMKDSEKKMAKHQTNMVGELIDYKANGSTLDYIGEEKFEGVKSWKLRLVRNGNDTMYYFINKEDNLILATKGKMSMQGKQFEVTTLYSNYKEVDGVKFAFDITRSSGSQVMGETTITKIETNATIDEKIFDMPQ